MKVYCFVLDISFNDLGGQYALETSSVLSEKVNLSPADPLYNTCSARGQSSFAHDVFAKSIMENAGRLTGTVMAPGTRGLVICLDLMFHY